MIDKTFTTQTAPKTSIIYCTVFSLLFAILFAAAYYLLPRFSAYVFHIGALICLSCFGVGLMLAVGPPVTLLFKNDELFISDTNGKEYNVYATPVSDFVFIQTPLEKKYNVGCLRIKHTAFFMLGVKNISETKEYINNHFPRW